MTGAFAAWIMRSYGSGFVEGNIINVAGEPFQISYVGGDGNDLTLTRFSPPATGFRSFYLLGSGYAWIDATNAITGYAYTIQAATNLNSPVLWSNLAAVLPSANGTVFFTDTNAPLFPSRFYRIRSP